MNPYISANTSRMSAFQQKPGELALAPMPLRALYVEHPLAGDFPQPGELL